MDTPLLFIIFNRPDTTQRVFEVIKQAKPKQLFIAADGPRDSQPDDAKFCAMSRAVTEQIDWPCEVYRKYEIENLGCKLGVSSAINWFFHHVDRGIILEDDCLPDPSFFLFCEDLLIHYRNDDRVMMISGNNFIPDYRRPESYYFSRYAHIWGWATWRRAWQHYDGKMSLYPSFKRLGKIKEIIPDPKGEKYWTRLLDLAYSGTIDTWDTQWQYAIFQKEGLCAVPKVNLVSNIGFGAEATHTTATNSKHAELRTQPIGRLTHPTIVTPNDAADNREIALMIPNLTTKLVSKIKKLYYGHL